MTVDLSTCSWCGEAISPPAQPHRFETSRGRHVEVLCDGCCPRCWADRREAEG